MAAAMAPYPQIIQFIMIYILEVQVLRVTAGKTDAGCINYQLVSQIYRHTKVMKQNISIGMNQPASCLGSIPRYSDKYKDVLQRALKREHSPTPAPKPLFFYRVRSIGVGAFSFVHLVCEEATGLIFAQKSINKKSIAPELATQIRLHLQISHANIVTLYHIYPEEGYLQMIMQYAGDSLFSLRKHGRLSKVLPLETVQHILGQLINAVDYLHSQNIVHADIKLENLLYLDGVVKLCDMGYAHRVRQHAWGVGASSEGQEIVGTLEYLDPEYVQGRVSEFERDVWAVGVVAYELLTGGNPFQGMAENEKWSTILKIKQISLEDLQLPGQWRQFLSMTLCPLSQRARIRDLQQLPLFRTQGNNPRNEMTLLWP